MFSSAPTLLSERHFGLADRGGPGVLRAVTTALGTWSRRRRSRHALARLDDHLLRDVGLTRSDVALEAGKPFWHR